MTNGPSIIDLWKKPELENLMLVPLLSPPPPLKKYFRIWPGFRGAVPVPCTSLTMYLIFQKESWGDPVNQESTRAKGAAGRTKVHIERQENERKLAESYVCPPTCIMLVHFFLSLCKEMVALDFCLIFSQDWKRYRYLPTSSGVSVVKASSIVYTKFLGMFSYIFTMLSICGPFYWFMYLLFSL